MQQQNFVFQLIEKPDKSLFQPGKYLPSPSFFMDLMELRYHLKRIHSYNFILFSPVTKREQFSVIRTFTPQAIVVRTLRV